MPPKKKQSGRQSSKRGAETSGEPRPSKKPRILRNTEEFILCKKVHLPPIDPTPETPKPCKKEPFSLSRPRGIKPKPKRRGRPPKSLRLCPPTVVQETGALLNFGCQNLLMRKNKKFELDKSYSLAWLKYFTESEKQQLLLGLQKLGSDASATALKKGFLPHRSLEDITEFLRLLKANAKKIALSPGFDLGFGMSPVEIMNCKNTLLRCDGKEAQEYLSHGDRIQQGFLTAADTAAEPDEPVDEKSIHFDRIYRIIAKTFDPSTLAEDLRSLGNKYDMGFISRLLQENEQRAGEEIQQNTPLARAIKSHVESILQTRKPSTTEPVFAPGVPDGPGGGVARRVSCIPELNPFRIPPDALIGRHLKTELDGDVEFLFESGPPLDEQAVEGMEESFSSDAFSTHL